MGGNLVPSRRISRRVAVALGVLLLASAVALGFHATAQAQTSSTVFVPARDGTLLAADVYLPAESGRFPVLFQLTPYNKVRQQSTAEYYVSRGYAVVVADSRGIYGSQGIWTPYMNEASDGYDIQQWIGQQPWSNGRVGTFGCSYPGFTQLLPAPYRSPYVKALLPECAQGDNFGAIWSTNGIYQLALGPAWGTNQEATATGQPRPNVDWAALMWHLPLKTLTQQTGGVVSQFVQDTIDHHSYDDFWRRMSVWHLYGEMDVPAFHTVGWYDDLVAETFRSFTSMRKLSQSAHARRWQKLLVGPWGHGARPRQFYGDMDFGTEVGTSADVQAMRDRWFDYHVKGIKNGLEREDPILIFVMGANKWRGEREWPLARRRPTELYLRSEGAANSRFGDGRLSLEAPGTELPDRYEYDPRDPVMTHGGHGCCPAVPFAIGPYDQRGIQDRQDVLVYTSDVLAEDVEVTGSPKLRLFFSTNVTDTDFFVRLSDVHPDGKTIVITEGSLRTRFRKSLSKPKLLKPDKIYEVTIALWETSNVFKEGHRIRVHVTSSNFPRYNRNLNSGKPLGEEAEDDIRVATQTIYHDRQYPSSIELPLIPPHHKLKKALRR